MKSLRNTLRETIFMRLCICFCLGIIAYRFLNTYLTLNILLLCLALLLVLFIYYKAKINAYHYTFQKENGLIVYFSIALFAFVLSYFQDQRNNVLYFKSIGSKSFTLVVENEGKIKKNKITHEVVIVHNHRVLNRALISIKNKKTRFQPGDTLTVIANLLPIESKKHPAEFDYKNYLINKGIYHQIIIDSLDITSCKHQQQQSFSTIITRIRKQLIETLANTIKNTDSYEMATALLLGERADIDKATMKSYSDTGTIHIISVSGLHVGIIYFVFSYALNLLRIFNNKYVKTIVIIVFIWLYACITGLPSSVIRSALMISFLCIGKAINSKTNTMNHIAASAFLILCIDTNYLFDIGFQLSYLAVIGIVYLQKPIYDLYQARTIIDKYIWLTFSVSIAAQLFTLPLCMYYFHQFPNYFLLANLLAIPLSSIALYASIACLLFSKIPYLNLVCDWVVNTSITILNSFLQFMSNLPGAVYHSNPWSAYDALFCALFICFLMLWLIEKIRPAVIILLSCCIVYISMLMLQKHHHQHLWKYYNQGQITYSIETKDSTIHFISTHMKDYELNRFKQNCDQFYTNKQVYKLVEAKQFSIYVNTKIFSDSTRHNAFQAVHYERICL